MIQPQPRIFPWLYEHVNQEKGIVGIHSGYEPQVIIT